MGLFSYFCLDAVLWSRCPGLTPGSRPLGQTTDSGEASVYIPGNANVWTTVYHWLALSAKRRQTIGLRLPPHDYISVYNLKFDGNVKLDNVIELLMVIGRKGVTEWCLIYPASQFNPPLLLTARVLNLNDPPCPALPCPSTSPPSHFSPTLKPAVLFELSSV